MAKTISANCLFHFTHSLEAIRGILRRGFLPRYVVESHNLFPPKPWSAHSAVPMTCFCDIPLAQTAQHSSVYGSYALGLTKTWGRRNGITPVVYLYAGSPLVKEFLRLRDFLNKQGKGALEDPDSPAMDFYRAAYITYFIERFFKPYEGRFEHNSKTRIRYRFYDEREWRYVPDTEGLGVGHSYLAHVLEFEPDLIAKDERLLARHSSLRFTPKDLRYVLVSRESERDAARQLLEDFGHRIKQTVAVRRIPILTWAQISTDF